MTFSISRVLRFPGGSVRSRFLNWATNSNRITCELLLSDIFCLISSFAMGCMYPHPVFSNDVQISSSYKFEICASYKRLSAFLCVQSQTRIPGVCCHVICLE